jgi:thioredoxin 1
MGDIKDVSDELFLDLLRKERRFIVLEMWSPGCSVCKEVEGEVVRAQKELAPDVVFMCVNVDHNNILASRYRVTGTPSFLFFCDGHNIGGITGFVSATALRNSVRDLQRHSVSCPSSKRPSYEMDGYG